MRGDLSSRSDAIGRNIETLQAPVRMANVKGKQIVAITGSKLDDLPRTAAMTRNQIAQGTDAILIVLLRADPQNSVVDLPQTQVHVRRGQKIGKMLGPKPSLASEHLLPMQQIIFGV